MVILNDLYLKDYFQEYFVQNIDMVLHLVGMRLKGLCAAVERVDQCPQLFQDDQNKVWVSPWIEKDLEKILDEFNVSFVAGLILDVIGFWRS